MAKGTSRGRCSHKGLFDPHQLLPRELQQMFARFYLWLLPANGCQLGLRYVVNLHKPTSSGP